VETTAPTKPEKKPGIWILLVIIGLNILASWAIGPVMPHVQVAPEALTEPVTLPFLGDFSLTNTMIAVLIADLMLFWIAFRVNRELKDGDLSPKGVSGALEAVIQPLYDLTVQTAHKWADWVFPWVASLVFMIVVVNWMELVPGVDSIGFFHEPHHGAPVYETRELFSIGGFRLDTITAEVEEGAAHNEAYPGFIPAVRVASTDLNFTLGLAITAVVAVQILGVKASGAGYFKKFFNFDGVKEMFSKREDKRQFAPLFAFTDLFVGLLELVSEFARIISFGFRLFGNIFAGTVLLFVMGSLVPVLVDSVFMLLEIFVGMIQALVFGMLTLVFMAMATISHDGH